MKKFTAKIDDFDITIVFIEERTVKGMIPITTFVRRIGGRKFFINGYGSAEMMGILESKDSKIIFEEKLKVFKQRFPDLSELYKSKSE